MRGTCIYFFGDIMLFTDCKHCCAFNIVGLFYNRDIHALAKAGRGKRPAAAREPMFVFAVLCEWYALSNSLSP